jgi:hypothetical protein
LWAAFLAAKARGMAKPRFTTRVTVRLDPTLRDDLLREAAAEAMQLADLIRSILADRVSVGFEWPHDENKSERPLAEGYRTRGLR